MNNKEKYKDAFSSIHTSRDFSLEVDKMKNVNKKPNKLVAGLAVGVLLLGSAGIAYANDIGGIRRTVQMMFNGNKTDVTFEFDGEGNYEADYIDSEGNNRHKAGGAVIFNEDGTITPVTDEEVLIKQFSSPDVVYNEDGSVVVQWHDQETDITDKFEDGVCYVELVDGDEKLYVTVRYKDGFVTSPEFFMTPESKIIEDYPQDMLN